MEIQLLPAISLLPIVSVLIAPEEMLRSETTTPTCSNSASFLSPIRSGILDHAGQRAHRGAGREEDIHLCPSQDHPGGEPPPLPDSGAQPLALRRGQGYGGPCCPGHEAGLAGGILLYAPVLDRHLEAMAAPTGSSASMICRGRPTAKAEESRRSWQARPPRFS